MTVPFQVQTNALKRKLLFYSFPLYSFITFLSSYACSYLLSLRLPFFFFFLSLLFFFPLTISLSLFLVHSLRRSDSDSIQIVSSSGVVEDLKLSSPIFARPVAIADLCSSSSTALVVDLAADGWLSLFID